MHIQWQAKSAIESLKKVISNYAASIARKTGCFSSWPMQATIGDAAYLQAAGAARQSQTINCEPVPIPNVQTSLDCYCAVQYEVARSAITGRCRQALDDETGVIRQDGRRGGVKFVELRDTPQHHLPRQQRSAQQADALATLVRASSLLLAIFNPFF